MDPLDKGEISFQKEKQTDAKSWRSIWDPKEGEWQCVRTNL